MRVMMRMFTTTYGESVSSTPMWAMGEPSGPMLNGITYIVRPRMQPSNRPCSVALHLRRLDPVVVGAGVVLLLTADEGAVFHARHIRGVGAREEAVRALLRR